MRVGVILLTLGLLFPVVGGAEPETGTVCVASRAATPFRGHFLQVPGHYPKAKAHRPADVGRGAV